MDSLQNLVYKYKNVKFEFPGMPDRAILRFHSQVPKIWINIWTRLMNPLNPFTQIMSDGRLFSKFPFRMTKQT